MTTTAASTVLALRAAEGVVCSGGTVSVTCYPGHPEGKEEEEEALAYASCLEQREWSVYQMTWLNQRNKRSGCPAPRLLLLQRLH